MFVQVLGMVWLMLPTPVLGASQDLAFVARWGQSESSDVLQRGMETAARDERPLLLVFTALGCPPCDLLRAEALNLDIPFTGEQGFIVVRIDVDDPTAWKAKDAYDIQGYPTVVAADPKGNERDRFVGYSGPDEFASWLDAQHEQAGAQLNSDDVDGLDAAALAWKNVRQGRGEVGTLLSKASSRGDDVVFRLARFWHEPTLEDARWLSSNAPGRALDWVPAGASMKTRPGWEAVLRGAVLGDLAGASGIRAADLLALAASLPEEKERPVLYGAAAVAMRAVMTNDPQRDRGYYLLFADWMEKSGDWTGAVALLRQAAQAFESEPTFHLALARSLFRGSQLDEALTRAQRAYDCSWGDNKLKAGKVLSMVLLEKGKRRAAREAALRALEEVPPAPAGSKVRSHGYRAELMLLVNRR